MPNLGQWLVVMDELQESDMIVVLMGSVYVEKQYRVLSEEKIKKVARCILAYSVQRIVYRCGEQV